MRFLKSVYYKLLKFKNRVLVGRPVMVLMYHRVNDIVDSPAAHLTVSVSDFEKQLQYFTTKYQILGLRDDWRNLKKTGIVLTFDDGYADNYTKALPLLEKYNIPATFFITTENIDTKEEFWWDRLNHNYIQCDDNFFIPGTPHKVSKNDNSLRSLAIEITKLKQDKKREWLEEWEKKNGISYLPRPEYRSMTIAEVMAIEEHPLLSVGLHTHNHYPLGQLTYKEQKEELELSMQRLKELGIKEMDYLALPNGSYNAETTRLWAEFNFSGVLLANNYYSSAANKKTKKINRILMPSISGKAVVKYLKKFE